MNQKILKWDDVLYLAKNPVQPSIDKIEKTESQWMILLTEEEFQITRLKSTEMPHSSNMCSRFEPGIYACKCCKTPLFDNNEKFDSGTGWPSFTQPIKSDMIAYHQDQSHGMIRVEVTCNICDAHLGHVFPDGPEPSGLRYCINALALKEVGTKL